MNRNPRIWMCLLALVLTTPAVASFVDYAKREINMKVVYLAADGVSAEANLDYVHAKTNTETKGKKIKLGDGPHDLSFFTLTLGESRGFKTRFHLYAQVGALPEHTLRDVLKGADAVVFVADSDPARMEANAQELAKARALLAQVGHDKAKTPVVFQLVNREHPHAVPVEELKQRLGVGDGLVFLADPKAGTGVFDTLKGTAKLCLQALKKESSGAAPAPAKPAQP